MTARACTLIALGLATACSSTPDPVDVCADNPVVAGGSVELGFGTPFKSITDGQDVDLVLGTQGLYMFVVNVHAHEMTVSAQEQGGVAATAVVASGHMISLGTGCRARYFADAGGELELASPYLLPMDPNADNPDGATITVHLEVRDGEGHRATADHTVIAHLPR